MKKTILAVALASCAFANAQYFEDFENGVPGTMIQKSEKGEGTFMDFSIAAVGVENPLGDTNSAVFWNGIATDVEISTLQTPVLDLSSNDYVLEFKHFQRLLTDAYSNKLEVALSMDGGETWQTIATYDRADSAMVMEKMDLHSYTTTDSTVIKFSATQLKVDAGFPIVLDDIAIHKKESAGRKGAPTVVTTTNSKGGYPNPTTGVFNIITDQKATVTVTDGNGRTVVKLDNIDSATPINLSSYPKGVYIVQATTPTTTETYKILLK